MTDKHTLAPPELAERALVEELATQMALAAGYAPHCWPTWEQEATVIIPTITKHMANRITALEAREAELVAHLRRMITAVTEFGPHCGFWDWRDDASAFLAKHQEGEGDVR